MTQANTLVASAAVIALTLGIGGQTPTPVQQEQPLSTGDGAIPEPPSGRSRADDHPPRLRARAAIRGGASIGGGAVAEESANMGKQEGTQSGENQGDVPKSKTDEAPPY